VRRYLGASAALFIGALLTCGACGHGSSATERVVVVTEPDGAVVVVGEGDAISDTSAPPFDAPPSAPTGPCNAVEQQHAIEGFTHVPVCSYVTYGTKPPSSGNHYPIWAAFMTYATPAPEGFWVHDLEHGAIVFSYDCPDEGCASDIAAAQTYIDGMPADPLCVPADGDPRVRMTMTPDPNLDVRFAASAWGWTLRADCFDPVAFGAFVTAHYGQGREQLCGQGDDVSSGLAADCGDEQ
jgi:hypothetical protein